MQFSNGQSLNLQSAIGMSYSTVQKSFYKGRNFCFVIPTTIGFIDTTTLDTGIKPKVKYFKRQIEFEKFLKKVGTTYVLEMSINKLGGEEMEIIFDVSEIDSQSYFIQPRIFTFFDKRKVKFVFNTQKQNWEYASLVKVWAHPHPGDN
jgi:hypothetical protein